MQRVQTNLTANGKYMVNPRGGVMAKAFCWDLPACRTW